MNARARHQKLVETVRKRRKALEDAELDLEAFVRDYCKRRPLRDKDIAAMVARVKARGALCCEEGRAWASEHLPWLWASMISGWAYENLGCKSLSAEDVEEYVQKIQNLDRRKPPKEQ